MFEVLYKNVNKKVSIETVMVMIAGINLLMILLAYVLFNKERINQDMTLMMPMMLLLWGILIFAGMVSLGFAFVYFHMIKVISFIMSLLLATLPVFVLLSSFFIIEN